MASRKRKSFVSSKLFAFIAAILILGAFFYIDKSSINVTYKTTEETANWKTYKSPQLDFELKYPTGWEPKQDPIDTNNFTIYPPKNSYEEEKFPQIYILRWPNPKKLDTLSWIKQANYCFSNDLNKVNYKNIKVNDHDAVLISPKDGDFPICTKVTILLFKERQMIYQVRSDSETKKYKDIFMELASSFRLQSSTPFLFQGELCYLNGLDKNVQCAPGLVCAEYSNRSICSSEAAINYGTSESLHNSEN